MDHLKEVCDFAERNKLNIRVFDIDNPTNYLTVLGLMGQYKVNTLPCIIFIDEHGKKSQIEGIPNSVDDLKSLLI